MIFEGKSLTNISDDEIEEIVRKHVSEHQHLEFKVTVNLSDDKNKREVLRDITSFANASGGYLIIGVRDDGKGRAQKFEAKIVGDTERIKKSLSSICIEYVKERIEGLQFECRRINKNPILIIRIPDSIDKPHMVTIGGGTDFYRRYEDGKIAMTRPEIREAFTRDRIDLQLNELSTGLKELQTMMGGFSAQSIPISDLELLDYTVGGQLAPAARDQFYEEIGSERFFRISATVSNPKIGLINPDSEDILNLFTNPPGSRDNGWNMLMPASEIKIIGDGIQMGNRQYGLLVLYENGQMEFTHQINQHFCWKQSDQEYAISPRLYPYPVIEFPTTFLRLWWAILKQFSIEGEFEIGMQYMNIKGTILRPYGPGSTGFDYSFHEPEPFKRNHLKLSQQNINLTNEPDLVAYDLVRRIYRKFGLSRDKIPFFDKKGKIFRFGESGI